MCHVDCCFEVHSDKRIKDVNVIQFSRDVSRLQTDRFLDRRGCHIDWLQLILVIFVRHPSCTSIAPFHSRETSFAPLPNQIESFQFGNLLLQQANDGHLKLLPYVRITRFAIADETHAWFTDNSKRATRSAAQICQSLSQDA